MDIYDFKVGKKQKSDTISDTAAFSNLLCF